MQSQGKPLSLLLNKELNISEGIDVYIMTLCGLGKKFKINLELYLRKEGF